MSAGPQLSSVATALAEMTRRITGIADEFAGTEREDIATTLYEVERALQAASRRLEKVVDQLT
jgi:hypothetical protein